MATKTDTTRTMTLPNWMALQHASILFDVAVETIERDVEALSDTGRVATMLQLAANLTGIDYDALFEAAFEVAAARRTERDRRWTNQRGLTMYDRSELSIPTPKADAVRRVLRGY